MKLSITCIFITLSIYASSQNPGEWMWVHGDTLLSSTGYFGVQGVPSPLNKPPALYEAIEWTDINGNFWLFGGACSDTYSALWMYDPNTNEWTWMNGIQGVNDLGDFGIKGVTSLTNRPPGKGWGTASWVDLNGDFWMFGGLNVGVPGNDLWKYSPAINQWTWMSGSNTSGQTGIYGTMGVPDPANCPGARIETSASWTDNDGNLWLFGGLDMTSLFHFNDMWRYEITTNTWTWMKGSSTVNATGNYGTKGIESVTNNPGSRAVHSHWKDCSGNLWFFGGGSASWMTGYFNDMWRFNPITNNWTWMSGNDSIDQPGLYISHCFSSTATTPGPRMENRATWVDMQGNFWMMGGIYVSNNTYTYNDLWKYCISSNEWIWIEGDSIFNVSANWGTQGVSSPQNKPWSRGGSIAWTNQSGNLYIFGGWHAGTAIGDLWSYAIDFTCDSCSTTPIANFSSPLQVCPGTCIDFMNNSVNACSYLWNFQGGSPSSSTVSNPMNICYTNPGSYDVQLIVTNVNGGDTLLIPNYITVNPYPPAQSISQSGDTLLANTGAVTYQWYFNGLIITGATQYFYVASASGDYNVVATDSNECEVEAVINNVIAGNSTFSNASLITVSPIPTKERILLNSSAEILDLKILDLVGNVLSSQAVLKKNFEIDVSFLSSGIYFLQLRTEEGIIIKKFIRE